MPIKRTAYLSAMLGFALILSYVESLIPFYFGVPGMKLGLTNLLVVILLYRYSAKDALCINLARIILAGFLFGNGYGILYGLCGGLLSFVVMVLLKRSAAFSVVGVSAAGGAAHNAGQLAAAVLTVSNYRVAFYGPVLLAAGCVTGVLIGILAAEVIKRIRADAY